MFLNTQHLVLLFYRPQFHILQKYDETYLWDVYSTFKKSKLLILAYRKFDHKRINDTANDCDEVKSVPRVFEVTLHLYIYNKSILVK